MNRQDRQYALVLSIYLNTRGFAFVLFKTSLSPHDWGMREVRGLRKQQRCLDKMTALLDFYEPDVLVLQNTSLGGTVRVLRLARLNTALASVAERRGIPIYSYSRAEVHDAFDPMTVPNKVAMAELIAKHIPAFERYVPPPRKPWMSEDARMGLFDAAALGLIFFFRNAGESQ